VILTHFPSELRYSATMAFGGQYLNIVLLKCFIQTKVVLKIP